MRFSNWLIGLAVAVMVAAVWFVMNRPVEENPFQGDLKSLSYAAWRQNPALERRDPTIEEIRADLEVIAGQTRAIRTYESAGISGRIPALAAELGLTVTAGAWIDVDPAANEREMAALIATARNVGSVNQVIVGNEFLHRHREPGETMDFAQAKAALIGYLRRARAETEVPVSTAEPFDLWLQNPDLADEVDFITVHILPFWNGINVEQAVQWTMERYEAIRQRFPDKRILIGEVGWPSEGLTRNTLPDEPAEYQGRGGAEASPVNQGLFLRRFLLEAKKENIDYNIIEAFDQPWKIKTEGGVGAYWGLWNAERQLKPALEGTLINFAGWQNFAIATVAIGLPFVLFILRSELGMTRRGRFFVALLGFGGVLTAVLIYAQYSQLYLSIYDLVALAAVAPAFVLLLAIFLIEGLEMAVNLWLGQSRRRLVPPPLHASWRLPKVSVHVPCYNEPPDMMIETIRALEKLDYPDFEVLVIDNNTRDEAVWRPVEAYINGLDRPNFRFFHLPKWPGFKAGALNYALTVTHPEAEIIATIDSDYVVRPRWLSDLVPHFADPGVALVQAPQDYRDGHEDLFKRLCFWEYAGFFHLGMKTRDEKNAIIQHGTMALIRRAALTQVGGWGEWCITEDAELGLRLFEHGHRAIYTEKSYGRGLMPDSFDAYRKQRYRWAYGAMQILKRHWRELMPFTGRRLEPAQRYQFLAGWLPWIADGLQLSFVALAILWTLGMIFYPQLIAPPLALYLFVTIGMFLFKVGKSFWLYAEKVPCSFLDNLGASLAGLALSYAVGKAVWRGIFTSNLPFHRTPKMENAPAALRGLVTAWEETLVFLALIGCGLLTLHERWVERDAQLWALLCFVQALPFGAALVLSMINALRLGRSRRPTQPSLQAAIALADGRPPQGPNSTGPNSRGPKSGGDPAPEREAA
jgi:cellulose synthase/poly-beta-1,6-N-acetylglucosamine synthase-like glycosyltransferase/exo-beta-1,3-glucanase (GH17 family)